jgi:hypothetical protein
MVRLERVFALHAIDEQSRAYIHNVDDRMLGARELGLRPLMNGILSVEATETSSGHFKPMSASARQGHEAVAT